MPARSSAQELPAAALAAYLLQCCRYTEWPATAFRTPSDPVVIGIAGADPFGPVLDSVLRGHFVKGRRVQALRFGSAPPQGCHLLFVSEGGAAPMVLQPGRPVLTVSTQAGFLEAGGIIRLDAASGKPRLLVCPAAARASGLGLSSKLLRLATILE